MERKLAKNLKMTMKPESINSLLDFCMSREKNPVEIYPGGPKYNA